ncbi:MAG TPA: bifunctional 2-polyprenyl-6-hydroxyphenol methylase/3-demethylubiquinol 3-O-methyltransferase UbiG [Rhodospirillales bacterium]|nr:bifunctional 2-polyprenyl-6-hydroxyphenol methylase/3-demethylubiquinol 3-O-methyltransferase UbiG [Rhodospirillales bacterium]
MVGPGEGADAAEIGKFAELADAWWDPDGPMRPLHLLNPVRIAWIREQAARHFGLDLAGRRPLVGVRALDIGCGGGLLAEPLARLGAAVTAVDPAEENIARARERATAQGLAIDYRRASAEEIAAAGEAFDLVLAMEVIEHVPDPARFAGVVAALVAPGGLLVMSTVSRTLRAFALAVVGAEYLLGWLPPGTHDWRRFVRPAELAGWLRGEGLRTVALTGVAYDPGFARFRLVRDPGVNYMLAARRAAAPQASSLGSRGRG